MHTNKIVLGLALAALALLVLACGSDNPLAPFSPEVNNVADNFQFQITDATNVTTTVSYNWDNSGTLANVNQSCAITGGTAVLTVYDADTTQVYTRNLADNGTFPTTAGTTGTWIIRVSLSNLSGTLNFRAQKP